MRFRIRHVTTYRYDRPITLGRHVIRLRPREDGLLTLDSFALSIHPPPAGLSPVLDLEGNATYVAWFDSDVQELRVSVRSEGRTLPRPSLLLEPDAVQLPVDYGMTQSGVFAYLRLDPMERSVTDFAHNIARESEADTLTFLNQLNQRLHEQLQTIQRLTGEPLAPEQTLRDGKGSCRDLAVLFVACCRSQGIAARFVSGYFPAHPGDKQHMHAWAEAYLPGAGWRAYDPTQGGEVGDRHVAVAAAAESLMATPIFGFYNGDARSGMDIELSVDILED